MRLQVRHNGEGETQSRLKRDSGTFYQTSEKISAEGGI